VFLSTGYHVITDIPATTSNRRDTVVTAPIGPDPRISEAALARLAEAGERRAADDADSPLALISAGSSDPKAREQLEEVAAQLRELTGLPVSIGQLTDLDPFAGVPDDAEVVNYLLAPGFFDDQLRAKAGGRVVGRPIGAHPLAAEVIVARYLDVIVNRAGCDL
jgi:sirohydrochlorin ferrochelatase